jgi:hypothetical protein
LIRLWQFRVGRLGRLGGRRIRSGLLRGSTTCSVGPPSEMPARHIGQERQKGGSMPASAASGGCSFGSCRRPSLGRILTTPITGTSRPPRPSRRLRDKNPLMRCLAFGRKTKEPSCLPGSPSRSRRRPRLMECPGWAALLTVPVRPAYSSHSQSRCSFLKG